MSAALHHAAPARQPNAELLLWRLLFATFLAGASIGMRYLEGLEILRSGLMVCLIALYGSIGGAWLLTRTRIREGWLLTGQLGADVICIQLLVHYSGGPQSAFPLLFCVPIVLGAYYLGSRGSIILSGLASIFTGGGQLGYAMGWWLLGREARTEAAFGQPVMLTVIYVFLFLTIGLLSGLMASRAAARQRLQLQATSQMHKAKSEVRSILDNLRSGLLIMDNRGIITRANTAAGAILGVHGEHLVGQPLQSALMQDLAAFAACVETVARGSEPLVRHELYIRRDGREVPIGVSVSALEDQDGQPSGAIAIFQDLTEVHRMRDRMREADRLAGVGELAASIAHEIRNPLASIRGSVEILAGELALTGKQEQLLELILKESGRVNEIINEFLSFARIRPANRRPLSCAAFLDEAALQLQQHIAVHGGGIALRHEVEPADLVLLADDEQLVQLVLNLAINACEAMEYSGSLEISARATADGEWCELILRDSGPGLRDIAREELFKPFVTTKKNGTGLGLPMVARIAHGHGGSVQGGNRPEGGAEFRVRLPLRPHAEHGEPPGLSADEVPVEEIAQPVDG
jgi:two-component system sensor histidine kinase PilS (NtrC family)